MKGSKLVKFRKEIDKIDEKIVKLFAKRFKVVGKIGKFKKENNIPVVDNDRFNKLLVKVKKTAIKNDISADFIEDVYNLIHEHSCELEK